MKGKCRFLAALGMTALLLATPAAAQMASVDSVWDLDSRVVQVVSGGGWIENGRSGGYRVIIRSDGVDSTHYSAVIQWMARRDGTGQDLELVASVKLATIAPRWYSMLDPNLILRRGRWILTLDASTAAMKPASHRVAFNLGPPGQVTVR